jgi:hypothetical protein
VRNGSLYRCLLVVGLEPRHRERTIYTVRSIRPDYRIVDWRELGRACHLLVERCVGGVDYIGNRKEKRHLFGG